MAAPAAIHSVPRVEMITSTAQHEATPTARGRHARSAARSVAGCNPPTALAKLTKARPCRAQLSPLSGKSAWRQYCQVHQALRLET